MSTTADDQEPSGEQRFVQMLDGRLGRRRNPALRLVAISLEPAVAVRLDAELERLVRRWAEPGDRGWWLAYGIGELRSVFIEAAVSSWLDELEHERGERQPDGRVAAAAASCKPSS